MNKYYPKDFTYPSFAPDFKATFYDPAQWLDIFNSSGAKYIVFVSKHHEGYCNWPSKHSWNWNSMDVGPKRDLLGIFTRDVKSVFIKTNRYLLVHQF